MSIASTLTQWMAPQAAHIASAPHRQHICSAPAAVQLQQVQRHRSRRRLPVAVQASGTSNGHAASSSSSSSSSGSNGSAAAGSGASASSSGSSGVVENLVIIGSGPAGYTAAIYAARANLRPLVFEGLIAGGVRGGQLMTTTEVENFPGFPEGISGPDLMDRMRLQAERWGSRLLTEDVESVDLTTRPFTVRGSDTGEVRAHAVIVATGATAKRLGIPSEHRFWSAGISACAICDGASFIFKQQQLAVVGGGDTATEEALYLTKYASHVHLLVRGERLRASAAMQDRVAASPKITVHLSTEIEDAFGDAKGMQGLHLKDTRTGERRDLPVRGLFYGIGHRPNSSILGGQVALDAAGYVLVHDGAKTSVEGVFAAGDLHDTEWRQAITAAGSGCQAALAAERYLAAAGLVEDAPPQGEGEGEGAAAAAEAQQQAEDQAKQAAAAASSSSGGDRAASGSSSALSLEAEFNIYADRHAGQFALRRLYHESDRLLAVLYTAPTCGPCRTLKPILSKVLDEYPGKVHFVEIDIEQDPEIAQAAGVNGTPTVQFFKNKERVQSLPGVKMKREYKALIEAHISP